MLKDFPTFIVFLQKFSIIIIHFYKVLQHVKKCLWSYNLFYTAPSLTSEGNYCIQDYTNNTWTMSTFLTILLVWQFDNNGDIQSRKYIFCMHNYVINYIKTKIICKKMFVYFKYGVCICNFQNGGGNIKISQVIVNISLQINGDS